MTRTPEQTLSTWLSKLNIEVSSKLIRQKLKIHPDYPSLLSITDLLDNIGIEHLALEIEKSQLHEIDTPFLAHLVSNNGTFVIVENRDTLETVYPGFFQNWTGVIVAAEKPATWSNKENNEALLADKAAKKKQYISITGFLLMALAACSVAPNWMLQALIVTSIAGIFVSWLIITKDLGIENKIADQACGTEAGCDAVIHSKTVKLPFGIGWSDIGFTWFTSLFIVLMLAAFAGNNAALLNILSLFAAAAIPFTFFSVYYQWRVAKKWCRLCLITVGLIWIQLATLFTPLIHYSWQGAQIKIILFLITVFLPVSIAWLGIKFLLQQNKNLEEDSFEDKRFKRNEVVFTALLEKQKRVDYTPWENDLQLGNADAALQLTVACNPYCAPCARVHEALHELIETYGDKMGLTIRFNVSVTDKKNKITLAVQYMLSHIEQATIQMSAAEKASYSKGVLHEWFKLMDYDKFIAIYPLTGNNNVDDTLKKQEEWINKINIAYTPTIFINGLQKPDLYSVEDLIPVIKKFTPEETVYNVAEV